MSWTEENDSLIKTYRFADFNVAMAFMVEAAKQIDKVNHHPEWTNVYNRVSVVLRTHDAGNKVTEKDRQLAILLDEVAMGFQTK